MNVVIWVYQKEVLIAEFHIEMVVSILLHWTIAKLIKKNK